MDKNLYTKDSIESLSPLEHVRLRPGVYVGDTSNPNQLVLEIFANALDEHNIGHGNKISVDIKEDCICSVEDNGQGFPVNEIREDGTSVLEASFSVMNTSGKFSDDGVYEGSSLGLNGMGSKATTFLSNWLTVQTWNNKKFETVCFKEGVFDHREVGKWSNVKIPSGTLVTFCPSKEFFTSNKVDCASLEKFFNEVTCLCPQLEVAFNGKSIKHEQGLDDLIKDKLGKDIEIISNRFKIEQPSFNLEMTFTSKTVSNIIPYVNYGLTESGQHITSIKSSITRLLNSWAKENSVLKAKDSNLDGTSIQEGMLLAFNIVSSGVGYDAQVKTRVSKIDTSDFAKTFSKEFEIWLDNNPQDAKNIIEKALLARKASEAAKKARAAVKNKVEKKKEKVFNLPTTLSDCWTKDRSKAELLVCEGKSAASGLVAARDSEFQAVYGVRGKMLSVLKTTPAKIIANQEINNLIQALGLDYNPQTGKMVYNKNKLRYGKIIAAADAKRLAV